MPKYCYTHEETSHTIERDYRMGQAPANLEIDGKTYWRDICAEHANGVQVNCRRYPYWREDIGCNPEQVPETMEYDRKMGVETEYDSTGRVKIQSKEHEKKYAEAYGYYETNGTGSKSEAQRHQDLPGYGAEKFETDV